jgi:hypothetical protein
MGSTCSEKASMAEIDLNPALEQVWKDLIGMTVNTLRYAVRSAGLEDTGELIESIEEGAVTAAKNWIEGSIYYDALLRLKDIKTLRYTTIPPLMPLMEWVERQGVDKFPFVPGYPNGIRKANEIDKIKRIAEGIRWNLKAHPNVTRNYRGRNRGKGVYNDVVTEIVLPEFWIALRGFAISYTIQSMSESFGITPVNLEQRVMNFESSSRMQAGQNAKQTKLARKLAWYQADRTYQNQEEVDKLLG